MAKRRGVETTALARRETIILPEAIASAGDVARDAFLEYFTARIRNPNTGAAYGRAVVRFFSWCEQHRVPLEELTPMHVAAYIEQHPGSAPTVKQHLAAIRMLLDHLVVRQVLAFNPANSVRGPKHVVDEGLTPILVDEEPRLLLASPDLSTLIGLRDRAILATMLYTFARVSAVARLSVGDYAQRGKRWWIRFHEKGGRTKDVPTHHELEEALDAYLEGAGIAEDRKGPLFRATEIGRPARLTEKPMSRDLIYRMIKRRATAIGFGQRRKAPSGSLVYESPFSSHSLRGTGITRYLENGGTREGAQYIAGHRSSRTTQLYDRRKSLATPSEIERIAY